MKSFRSALPVKGRDHFQIPFRRLAAQLIGQRRNVFRREQRRFLRRRILCARCDNQHRCNPDSLSHGPSALRILACFPVSGGSSLLFPGGLTAASFGPSVLPRQENRNAHPHPPLFAPPAFRFEYNPRLAGGCMSSAQTLREIRDGFERPFWIANITEIFERLAYYGAFASLALYLQQKLNFSTEQTGTLTGIFGGMVWFLAVFGGAAADRLGFRRALSLAYLILSAAYFLIGSIGASWLAPVRDAMPLGLFVGIILILPALGISLVKPCVVGTTARASKENVRSIGYSIYYTMVNIGGAAGPLYAGWAHRRLGVENVYRVGALSVFAMFFVVLLFFREPRKPGDAPPPSVAEVARNFCVVLGNYKLVLPVVGVALALRIALWVRPEWSVPWWIWAVLFAIALAGISRFMWFLVIFTGYWVVFWQQYISLPGYISEFINANANVERILATDGLTVICLTVLVNVMTRKI